MSAPTIERDEWDPFNPDGTWGAAWPPEVWRVRDRIRALGYKPHLQPLRCCLAIQAVAQCAYVAAYGHEPPRRGKRTRGYYPVFEHSRVEVLDRAIAQFLGQPR
jgi:hypothetical protein